MTGRQFVIADLHFGDNALCGRADGKGRPFASAPIMGHEIVARWNDIVAANDVVHVLGDIGRGRHCEAVRQLRGQKHLIAGNGDDVARLAATGIFASISVARWLPGLLLTHICQSACKRDPLSARKRNPLSGSRMVDVTRFLALRAA